VLILARGSPPTTASTAPTTITITATITIITTTVWAETSTSGFRRRTIRVLARLLADGRRLLRIISLLSVGCIIAAFA
jgi:hypothetical protein